MGENDQGQDKTGIKNPVGMEGCGIYNKAKDVCVKKEKAESRCDPGYSKSHDV